MSLEPAKQNFNVWRGATFRKLLTVYEDETPTSPRDLSGYSALLEIRSAPNEGAPLFTLSTANNRIALGGALGTIELIIAATDTAGFTWNTGVYDLLITAPGLGDTDPLLRGSFKVAGV